MLKVAYHPIYKYELPEGHRFPMEKYDLLPEQLLYENTLKHENFFEPPPLTDDEILSTHTQSYLDKLHQQSLSYKEVRTIGFPMRDALVQRGKHIAHGTYLCAIYAQHYGVAMNIAGGTHHSFADRGEGFCIFNDIAIASHLLLNRNQAKKILIVDLDVHQGNGTAKIFENNPQVFTFSMHGENNYPLRKEISNLDIGLPDKIEDKAYLTLLKDTLTRLVDTIQPDFIFYLAGVDILASDKLGRLSVSMQGCKERDKYVLSLAKQYRIPVACVMGGGYSPNIRDIIEAHANTFRVASDIYF